jgi:queuine tRNA-ribosyltransferase
MKLGADLIMPLDECPPWPAERVEVETAAERTARWAERSRRAHSRSDQWLFGIVQGGLHDDLRARSATQIMALDFPGYAIGGLSVGEPKSDMLHVLELLDAALPEDRPRYLMGVGTPEDIVEAVARGIDMFDCVLPTRNGRNGQLFTSAGRLSIRNARYREDPRPPDPACACPTCRSVSRAYLRHLHMAGEISAAVLMSVHNLARYLDTLRAIGQSIRLDQFQEFREKSLESLSARAAEGSL